MALSTNRTLITQTGINTHQVLNVGGLDSAGIATFSNFKTGSSNLHSTGLTVGDTFLHSTGVNLGTGATVSNNGNATFSGIITATSFVGDISNATGAAAGLGTALSQTQTDPLNKVYFTDKVLSISTTTTIDHPATANLAYTQYGDIKIDDGHDLIIKDGDDFKYDILGISTTKLARNEFPNGLSGNLTGDVTGNLNNNPLLLKANGSEKVRITSTGELRMSSTGRIFVGNGGNATDPMFANVSDRNTGLFFPSTDTLAFTTAGTERLRINSNGVITKPNQPGFFARSNVSNMDINTGDKIQYNVITTGAGNFNNRNSGYNATLSRFTAPVTGMYHFTIALYIANQNLSNICSIVPRINGNELSNGQDIIFFFSIKNAAFADTTMTGSMTMQLNQGDYVEVFRRNGQTGTHRFYGPHSHFCGFLIG